MQKKLSSILVLLISSLFAFGFFAGESITIKGSDTMVILNQKWGELFMNKNPGVKIQVTGGGSGTGISALINGTTNICASSRPLSLSEKTQLKTRYGSPGVEIKVAKDGITIYAHPSQSIKGLTMAQLKDIYTGKVTNWNQIGGKNARIVLYGRENSSGTYGFFKDHVLNGADFASSTQTLPGTAAIVNAILKDPNGIGYGGFAYTKGCDIIPVANNSNNYISPSESTIKNGTYPISRFLYFYTSNRPTGKTKEFIDWVLSTEGQSTVQKVGYFSIK
ncbi:MAG: phosphate ABC transporter substrate-binding protein [Chlorobiota bacterium]|nr:phosphate ABC transporter substrate-binding protein [Chlorobiota bacterium]QQS65488.1 MAG: phosphate ABC transporter substrate-binding protein [Chlorobiota bacterium]